MAIRYIPDSDGWKNDIGYWLGIKESLLNEKLLHYIQTEINTCYESLLFAKDIVEMTKLQGKIEALEMLMTAGLHCDKKIGLIKNKNRDNNEGEKDE